MSHHAAIGLMLAFLIGAAWGCDEGRAGGETTGGHGGSSTSSGGSGGGGGGNEEGGCGGTGGGGGVGEQNGGSGGAGGQGGLAWLYNEAIWRDLPHASSDAAQVRVREGLPGTLRFPIIQWTDCGPGCEKAVGTWYDPAMSTAVTSEGPRVVLSSAKILPDHSRLRMLADLRTGETKIVLRLDSFAPELPGASNYASSAHLTMLYSTDMSLPALYDFRAGGWDFKLPWVRTVGTGVDRWGVDSSPPALFHEGITMMEKAGSNERTRIPLGGTFGSGEGGAGLSVWSEITLDTLFSSRIRAWSPGKGVHVVVESMPGVACGLSVDAEKIVGIRSGDPDQDYPCYWYLRRPEFWNVPRSGGPISTWPLPVDDHRLVGPSTTWGDFAAASVYVKGDELSAAARSSVFLIRFGDGKMRRLVPTPGYEWRGGLLAMDDEHLYLGENLENTSGGILAQLYRFRLDRFDEIGMPAEQ